MTRYRSVLLLFLVLNLTACTSWHSVAIPSPAEFIEAEQPDRVRVTMQDGSQLDIEKPFVSGDQLLGKDWRTWEVNRLLGNADDVSVPLVDILQLEVRRYDLARSAGVSGLVVVGLLGALLYGASQGAGM
jgi:hypothetical protein